LAGLVDGWGDHLSIQIKSGRKRDGQGSHLKKRLARVIHDIREYGTPI
jgi:hypothetical protein